MELKFKVHGKVQRPLAEVFDAVANPSKLSRYFATGGASAPLTEGGVVQWRFADFPDVAADVQVKKLVPNELIVFEWESGEKEGGMTRTEMKFEALSERSTLVTISEWGWRPTQEGLDRSYGNCHGWTQMLCSLKAFVEHGINLREGFY